MYIKTLWEGVKDAEEGKGAFALESTLQKAGAPAKLFSTTTPVAELSPPPAASPLDYTKGIQAKDITRAKEGSVII